MRKSSTFTGAIAAILLLFASPLLFAELDLGLPTDNSEVISAFYGETSSLLTIMNKAYQQGDFNGEAFFGHEMYEFESFYPNSIPFYVNAHFKFAENMFEDNPYSVSLGSYIRLGDHFSLPLFAFFAGGEMNRTVGKYKREGYAYSALFAGSGLVWSSVLGTIGAFGGYYRYMGDEVLRLVKPDNALFENFKFGVIPVLNTGKFPLLKYAVSFIRNYLAFDFHEDKLFLPTYEVKGFSPRYRIGNAVLNSIYYGYGEKQANPVLKKQTHSGGFSMTIFELFTVDVDIGGSKYTESISGWYAYDDTEYGYGQEGYTLGDYYVHFDIFAGMRLGIFNIGMTFGRAMNNNTWGVILKFPFDMEFEGANNILGMYMSFNTKDGISGSDWAANFRQFHRRR
ncbi:MAG TPA: hypothetical protein DEQ14_08855 [Treponema sp.]|nr:hypothetical protein [Treponema sp.]